MSSLTFRLLVPVLLATLLLYAVVFGWILLDSRRQAVRTAETQAGEVGEMYAGKVSAFIERSFQIPRTMAAHLVGLKRRGAPLDRGEVNAMIRETLAVEKELLALYTFWEPNAFDGRDSQFVGTEGHDGTGKFLSCTHTTLRAIAERRPRTRADLARIQGMGEAKVERFGEAFLAVIADA